MAKKAGKKSSTPEPPPARQLLYPKEFSPEQVERLFGRAPSPEGLFGPAPSPEEIERRKAEQKQRDEDRKVIDRAMARERRPLVNVILSDAKKHSPQRPSRRGTKRRMIEGVIKSLRKRLGKRWPPDSMKSEDVVKAVCAEWKRVLPGELPLSRDDQRVTILRAAGRYE